MTRQASAIVADDVLFSLNGKLTIVGMYTGDIAITADPMVLPQLVFVFLVEGPGDDLPQSLIMEVTLPGEQPKQQPIPTPPTGTRMAEGRTRWFIKMPLAISPAVLRPGKIIAKVIHESGEIPVTTSWIVRATS